MPNSALIEYPCFLPNKGIVLNKPQEFLTEQFSPYSRNMEFYNEFLQGRYGVAKFSTIALSGAILSQPKLRILDGTRFSMFCTKKDIYAYDFSNSRFDILTPTYEVGKIAVTNASAKVYGGLEVDNCDEVLAWADGSGGDVTPTRTTVAGEFKEGTAGVKLAVGAGAGVELLAYLDISSLDLHAYDSIGFWFKSSVALSLGDLQFLLDNTSACASPLETINFPAISANTWTWVELPFVTPSALTAVISIGIKQAVDKGAMTLYIDQIVAGDWLDQLGVGDYIKVGSGSIHTGSTWYEVLTVDGDTSLTLTAVYAGSSAYQQSYVARQIFSGTDTDIWDWAQFSDDALGEVVIMTNGADTPVYWDGSGQAVALTGLSTDFASAKYVSSYGGRAIFAWTVEGGQNSRQRVRWSDPANCVSWQDEDFIDLADEPTECKGMVKFNGYLLNFKEEETYVGRFVGGTSIFAWERSAQFRGARSPWSIVARNDYVYYYADDKKFHRCNLLQDEAISETLFPETKEFSPSMDAYVQGYEVKRKNQIRWFCSYGNTQKNNYVFVWDHQNNIPLVWEYEGDDICSSMGSYIQVSSLYADDAIYGALYADETSGYADDSQGLASADIIIYGGYDGIVRIADSGVTDDGATYTRTLRLKRFNFNIINRVKRLWKQIWWLNAEVSGEVLVRMRIDDKTSYEPTSKTISLIPADEDKELIKMPITWNKHAQNFQPEISATNHFATLGCMNFLFPKKQSYRP